MTTKWSTPALIARLRLLRVLDAAPIDSAAASTKLRLIEITDQVDKGAIPTEEAEQLLTGLTDQLERWGNRQ